MAIHVIGITHRNPSRMSGACVVRPIAAMSTIGTARIPAGGMRSQGSTSTMIVATRDSRSPAVNSGVAKTVGLRAATSTAIATVVLTKMSCQRQIDALRDMPILSPARRGADAGCAARTGTGSRPLNASARLSKERPKAVQPGYRAA